MASYPDSVDYLYSLGNEIKSLKFGLESTRAVLQALGNPQDLFRSVHAAGTNGKGSTCAMIESALRESGFRTGLFTSPHLVEPTERIRIAGEAVSPADFARSFNLVHKESMALLEAGELEYHPTYFETVTIMAFVLFAEAGIDMAVLETGMGGRLDATNVVHPELCIITPIDLDHQQWLGSTLAAIAGEKAGILQQGVPVVFSPQSTEVQAVLTARAAELKCPAIEAADQPILNLKVRPEGSSFEIDGVSYQCPLAGAHQVDNALTAIAALKLLGIRAETIQLGLFRTQWPGRLEFVGRNPDILLDGAHNPAGAKALAAYLRDFQSGRKIVIVFGAMRDKSVSEISEIVFPLASHLVFTQPASPRSLPVAELEALAESVPSSSDPNIRGALDLVLSLVTPADLVLVTGSLYLVGEARSLLVK